jgi:Transposase C of IS166 homeodomain/zinc-finger binding domain of transposase IS66/Transposase IS66 family/IS66 C-terminal element
VITLKAMLRAERAARLAAEAEAQARTLTIEKLKLTIKKLRHEQFGQSSERGALLDQPELQLADLEENAAQAETAAHLAAAEKITVSSFERRKPARRPLPAHLPRERIGYPAPAICPCCGDSRLRKIGEDVTETLLLIPRLWKVIQHVREKFSCRACEAITQPPAPSHPIARGRGRLCLSNNAAERELRAVALGRKNWTFAGSDEGGRRAAAIYTLIATAKLNDVDPQAWLADVLPACRITPSSAFTTFCRGTGSRNTSPPKLLEPIAANPTPNYVMAFAGWIRSTVLLQI